MIRLNVILLGIKSNNLPEVLSSLNSAAKQLGIELSCHSFSQTNTLKEESQGAVDFIAKNSGWDFAVVDSSLANLFSDKSRPWIYLSHKDSSLLLNSASWKFTFEQFKKAELLIPSLKVLSAFASTQAELAHEKQHFLNVANSLHDGVRIADRNGSIMFVNNGMIELGGYSADEMIGATSWDLFFSNDPETTRLIGKRSEERLEGATENYEVNLTRKDGVSRWVKVKASPLRNAAGDIIGSISINSDITDKKEIQQQLAWSQKMEAVGQLAGGMAHDFNNLLTVITGYSEILLRKIPSDSPLRREVEIIDQAGRSGCALTQQLLALSHQKAVQPRVFDLVDAIKEISKMLKGVLGGGINFSLELPDEPQLIKADPSQVQQIIVNLALNARDAMENRGSFTVKIKEHEVLGGALDSELEVGHYISCLLIDSGKGMDRDVEAKIFEPFFSTKKGRGMGLGLSVVRSTMRELKGDIRVKKTSEKGTTFELFFPVKELKFSAYQDLKESEEFTGQESILLVEDDVAIQTLVVETLEAYGYMVIPVSNGKEALELFIDKNLNPDLILSDIVMPEMSGVDLVRECLKKKPNTKILLMSGFFDDDTIPEGADGKPLPFLPKPFTPKILGKRVRQVLEGSKDGAPLGPRKKLANLESP